MNTDNNIRYIVIDDHPDIRDGIQFYISNNAAFEWLQGFDNIRSALTEKVPGKVDVIILDLNLKNVDALRFVPELKRRFADCKIIAYTQYDGRHREVKAAGIDGYLDKSERHKLIEAMQTVMDGRSYFKDPPGLVLAVNQPGLFEDKMQGFAKLTQRQKQVAELVHHNFSNKSIGLILYTAESTVETHRKAIKQRLGVSSNQEFRTLLQNFFGIPENTCWPGGLPVLPGNS